VKLSKLVNDQHERIAKARANPVPVKDIPELRRVPVGEPVVASV
jgi:hypothetical protein